ncbi:hypothetical protein [Amphibiibacter pelophylacis]|uniref:Antitoxin VbhA family protein n=1 Tax=Amphibiibacter pelophylacis TaxID=1799477 RepID=A0ACC6P5G7_9BURK
MSKEVQMTFRVEPELRTEFSDAALREDRPAAQVLREFMRAYVNQSRKHGHSPANDAISPAESRRREAAVNFARSSLGLEGFKPSKAAETGARQFIKGDIQLTDFVQVKPDAEQAHGR